MKVKLIIISIILLLVIVFACGCTPIMEKLGLVSPTGEEQLSPEKGGPPDGLVKVLIGFKEKPGAAQQAMVKGVGGKIKYTYHIVDAIAASIPQKAIDALKKNPNVRYVELDGQVYALVEELENSWGVEHIGAGDVHASNMGSGVKVAIIDTGIDYTHEDLDYNYKGGIDIGDVDGDPMDDSAIAGHGTHVAGIVAAQANGIGVIGVAPEAHLYAVKVFDSDGIAYDSDVIAGIEWCIVGPDGEPDTGDELGIQVINMSIGRSGSSESLKDACDVAYAAEVVLVAAAGNNGNPPGKGDNIIYPAAYDSVIAVAATNQDDERARWSSTGPDLELAAPGVSIYSTYIGGGYATMSGTSMASPHVAGVAALVIASGTSGVVEVRAKLQDTADDLGEAGWDSKYGYGLVDADEAAGVPPPPPNGTPTVSITSPTDGSTFVSGATISFVGTADDFEDGVLTDGLIWTSNIDGQIGIG
ncbi:MAG: S8 family serine peptidase, partial [Sedimentisphaerales bacterium]